VENNPSHSGGVEHAVDDDAMKVLVRPAGRLLFGASNVFGSGTPTQGETVMKLLTGATGTAGSFIVKEFVRRQELVRVLVRDRAKAAALERVPMVEIVEGDVSRADTLGAALDGVDRVLMISAPRMDMVEMQNTFVDAAKAAGVQHVIKFSGLAAAQPETAFIFGRMHRVIEEYLEKSGLAWTHLRPTGFMQEYLREAPSVIH
jgi:uncharacterized protein YbjT (DUF2867 family)